MNSLLRYVAPLLALFVTVCVAQSSTGNSVLVVLEPTLKRADYSTFFGGIQRRGYELTFREPKDVKSPVIEFDVPKYSHVILFTPTAKSYADDITPQSLVSLLSKGTNLLVVLSTTQTPLSLLASEFSLSLPPPGTPLISHFPERPLPHTVISIPVKPSPVFTTDINPVIFSGAPHALGNNPFLVPILRAPPESFATDTDKDSDADVVFDSNTKGGEGLWAGSNLGVVTGFQSRSGGRVVFLGGVEMLSNEYAQKEVTPGVRSGNAEFSQDVVKWAFKETLVLRIDTVHHRRLKDNTTGEMYTTNDQLEYAIDISAYDPKKRSWEPYSDITDLQLDFTMLDPHIRTSLPALAGHPGRYQAEFRAPDRHGVFKFIVDWKRTGYTYLQSSTTVPVVPPRHDEYPRFISAAWPYYVGAFSTSVGFLAFSAIWLAGEVVEKKKTGKGKTE